MVKRIYPRLLAPPPGSFFLFGPRGAGKSTWLRSAFPHAHRVDLLDEALYQSYLADPGAFAGELRALPPRAVVLVDEVQLVLRRGEEIVAIEVRSGQKIFEADLRGLRAVAALRPLRRIVVCRAQRRQVTADGIEILPVAGFLRELEARALFP